MIYKVLNKVQSFIRTKKEESMQNKAPQIRLIERLCQLYVHIIQIQIFIPPPEADDSPPLPP